MGSYSVPGFRLPLHLGSHCSPGYFGMQPGSSEELSSLRGVASRFSMSVLDQADNRRRLVAHNDDSDVSSYPYPYATLLDGIR